MNHNILYNILCLSTVVIREKCQSIQFDIFHHNKSRRRNIISGNSTNIDIKLMTWFRFILFQLTLKRWPNKMYLAHEFQVIDLLRPTIIWINDMDLLPQYFPLKRHRLRYETYSEVLEMIWNHNNNNSNRKIHGKCKRLNDFSLVNLQPKLMSAIALLTEQKSCDNNHLFLIH